MALRAGHGSVKITPPLAIEMGGYHKPPESPRVIRGIRQNTAARALVLEIDGQFLALVSIDMCALSPRFTQSVKERVVKRTGIPADHVFVTATHTHSMPTLYPFLQWGAVDEGYESGVAAKAANAVELAKFDLADADAYLGKATVEGGNFNRTTDQWKSNSDFGPESTDADRWLDRDLHVLQFQRESDKGNIMWYHFSAHPVCYADDQAGPDWPGVVADRLEKATGTRPSFLQGHIGDVNPGDGTPWRGDLEETATAVSVALYEASTHAKLIELGNLKILQGTVQLPYDYARFNQELEVFANTPEACTEGTWVDAVFAAAWYEAVKNWDQNQPHLEAPIAGLGLGDLALLFHPGELYSYYGLQLRNSAPFTTTLCVGYTSTFVGYLPDPAAYEKEEYAAIVVPKILTIPPFTAEVGREFTGQCQRLLTRLAES